MSHEAARKFVERLENEESLRKKVKDVTEGVTKVGQDHGHHFTYEELQEALKEKWGVPKGKEGHADPHTCFSETPGY